MESEPPGQPFPAQELHFRAAFERAPTGKAMIGADGRLLRVNAAFCRLLGYCEAELLQKTVGEILLAGAPGAAPSSLLHEGSRQAGPAEMCFVGKQGQEIRMTGGSTLVEDGEGRAAFFVLEVWGFGEQTREERDSRIAALQADCLRLQAVLEVLPVGIFVADAHGTIIEANAEVERIWGAPPPKVDSKQYDLYKGWWSRTGEPVAAEEWALARALEEGVASQHEEIEIESFDGIRKTILNYALPVRTPAGEIVGGIAVNVDITDRKRAEEAMRRSEQRYRSLIEQASDGIFITRRKGRFIEVNDCACEMTGYTREELLTMRFEDLITEESIQALPPMWDRLLGGDTLRYEREYRRKDGTPFPVEVSARLIDEEMVQAIVRDITERKQYEQGLIDARKEAEAANRAKSVFLANMSHEIRTPLTGIIGFSSLLAQELEGEHQEFCGLIEQSGRRLMETLNAILMLAKLEAGHMETDLQLLNVAKEAAEMTALFRHQASRKGLTLDLEVADGAARLMALLDRGAFSSALQNLLSNAVKFTDSGGIVVRVDAAPGEGRNPGSVELHVEDTGIGIAPEFLPHLFEPFTQEISGDGRARDGSGLGLSIAKQLVEKMGGSIRAQSRKDEGTRFTLSFPLAAMAEEPATDGAAPAPACPALRFRALVVEDRPETQRLIKSLLATWGDVDMVATAEEALAEAGRTRYHAVLLDIHLGEGGDGLDVLQQLRRMPPYRNVPIAALTAYALPGDRERFLEAGFDGYLAKPFNAQELTHLITGLMDAHTG